MKTSDLYPYWDYIFDQIVESVESLSVENLTERPGSGAHSIRDIVTQLIREERCYMGQIVAGHAPYSVQAKDFPDARSLKEALFATREITRRVLEPFSEEGLRAVRAVPADQASNRPEANMPVRHIVWLTMQNDIFYWGQIRLRIDDMRASRMR